MVPRQICTLFLPVLFLIILPWSGFSQSIPVGDFQDDQLRLQILLNDTLHIPGLHRPFTYHAYRRVFEKTDRNQSSEQWWNRPAYNREEALTDDVYLGIQSFTIKNTLNTRLPYGENNGAAWYGRGNTTEFTAGLYLRSKYITVQFNPHLIYQENQDFLAPRFVPRDSNGIRYVAEGVGAAMDAPFRFGPDPFTTFDPGNSSIRLHYKQFEAGFSTEPLWWGPAARYPLVMSNNAPGIPHVFLNTREPVKLPYIGNVQLRWIVGYPRESSYFDGVGAGETRFTNALNIGYSPSLFKHLTIGMTRVYHLYETDGFDFRNITRVFDPLSRAALVDSQGEDGERQDRNQAASFYVHLALPAARAEIYGEFYREDHSYDLRDFINQPHHNSAYMFGLQKLSPFPFVDFIKTNIEFTNLTTSQLEQVRHQTYFYTHSRIRHGHTNKGQILGAAIGPGSNSQFVGIEAFKSDYKFGLFAQRVVDNDNFHFERGSASRSPSPDFGDYFRHRVDLNLGLNFLYGPGPFYLNSRLVWTKAFNYGRFDYGQLEGINIENYEHHDRNNVQFQIGITYIL